MTLRSHTQAAAKNCGRL